MTINAHDISADDEMVGGDILNMMTYLYDDGWMYVRFFIMLQLYTHLQSFNVVVVSGIYNSFYFILVLHDT